MVYLGPIMQVCYVTRSIPEMEKALNSVYGIKKWFHITGFETDPAQTSYMGKPVKFKADVSLGYSGDLQLEIICPVSGDNSPYEDFLSRSGPGLHHTCIEVENIDEAIRHYEQVGAESIFRIDAPGSGSYAYVRAPGMGSALLELAQFTPEMRAQTAAMKADLTA